MQSSFDPKVIQPSQLTYHSSLHRHVYSLLPQHQIYSSNKQPPIPSILQRSRSKSKRTHEKSIKKGITRVSQSKEKIQNKQIKQVREIKGVKLNFNISQVTCTKFTSKPIHDIYQTSPERPERSIVQGLNSNQKSIHHDYIPYQHEQHINRMYQQNINHQYQQNINHQYQQNINQEHQQSKSLRNQYMSEQNQYRIITYVPPSQRQHRQIARFYQQQKLDQMKQNKLNYSNRRPSNYSNRRPSNSQVKVNKQQQSIIPTVQIHLKKQSDSVQIVNDQTNNLIMQLTTWRSSQQKDNQTTLYNKNTQSGPIYRSPYEDQHSYNTNFVSNQDQYQSLHRNSLQNDKLKHKTNQQVQSLKNTYNQQIKSLNQRYNQQINSLIHAHNQQLQSLRQKNQQLQSLRQKNQQVEYLKHKITHLQKQLIAAQRGLNQMKKQLIYKLNQQQEQDNQQQKAQLRYIQIIKDQNNKKTQQLALNYKRIQQLEFRYNKLQFQLSNNKKLQQLELSNNKRLQQLESSNNKLQQLQLTIAKQSKQISQRSLLYTQLKGKLKAIQDQKKRLSQQLKKTQQSLSPIDEKLKRKDLLISDLTNQLKLMQQNEQKLKQKINHLPLDTTYQVKYLQVKDKYQQLYRDYSHLQKKHQFLNDQLQHFRYLHQHGNSSNTLINKDYLLLQQHQNLLKNFKSLQQLYLKEKYQKEDFQRLAKQINEENQGLQSKLFQLSKSKQSMFDIDNEQIYKLKSTIRQLEPKTRQLQLKIRQLQLKIRQLQDEKHQLSDENHQLKHKLRQLQAENHQLQDKLQLEYKEKDYQYKDLQIIHNKQLSQMSKDYQTIINQQIKQIQNKKIVIIQLDDDLNKQKDYVRQLLTEVNRIKEILNQQYSKTNKKDQIIYQITQELNLLADLCERNNTQLQHKNQQIQLLKDQLIRYKEKLTEKNKQNMYQQNSAKKALQSNIKFNLNRSNNVQSSNLYQLQQQIVLLQLNSKNLTIQKQTLQDQLCQKQRKIAHFQQEIRYYKQNKQHNIKEKLGLCKEIQALNQGLKQLKQKSLKDTQKISQLRQQNEYLKPQNLNLNQQLKRAKQRILSHEQQIEKDGELLVKLQKQFLSEQSMVQSLKIQKQTLSQQVLSLTNLKQSYRSKQEYYKMQCEIKQKQLQCLRSSSTSIGSVSRQNQLYRLQTYKQLNLLLNLQSHMYSFQKIIENNQQSYLKRLFQTVKVEVQNNKALKINIQHLEEQFKQDKILIKKDYDILYQKYLKYKTMSQMMEKDIQILKNRKNYQDPIII